MKPPFSYGFPGGLVITRGYTRYLFQTRARTVVPSVPGRGDQAIELGQPLSDVAFGPNRPRAGDGYVLDNVGYVSYRKEELDRLYRLVVYVDRLPACWCEYIDLVFLQYSLQCIYYHQIDGSFLTSDAFDRVLVASSGLKWIVCCYNLNWLVIWTCSIYPYIGNDTPNYIQLLIFFRGVETTN